MTTPAIMITASERQFLAPTQSTSTPDELFVATPGRPDERSTVRARVVDQVARRPRTLWPTSTPTVHAAYRSLRATK